MRTSVRSYSAGARQENIEPGTADQQKRGPASRLVAFTLVELLVVIGIIAVLISILLPSLNRAKQAAQTVQCLSNLHQLYLATYFYSNDNEGYFPACPYGHYQWPVPRLMGRLVDGGHWIKDPKVWGCPADATDQRNYAPGNFAEQYLGTGTSYYNISYAYNQTAGMLDNQAAAPNNYFKGYKPAQSKTPSYDPIFFDCEAGDTSNSSVNYAYQYCYARLDLTPGYTGQTGNQYYSGRHNGNRILNVVAGDGHAEGIDLRSIYNRLVPQGQDPQNRSPNSQARTYFLPWQTYVVRDPTNGNPLYRNSAP